MSTLYMADSITTDDLPETSDFPGSSVSVEYEAGYVNGNWANASANEKRFGTAKRLVTIDVNGNSPSADCLDVENGDATPTTAADWIEKRIAGGFNAAYPGVIYCNRSNITAVFNAMAAKGYKIGEHFRTWIATLDGKTKTVDDMTGVTAVQVWPATANSGSGHYDLSVVYDIGWKAPKAAPTPTPTPAPVATVKTIKSVEITFTDGTTQVVS